MVTDIEKEKPEKVGGEGDAPDEGHQGVRVEDQRAAEASHPHLACKAEIGEENWCFFT